MCGGSKGQSTQQQAQTYAPNPVAQQYITDALARGQQTANLPFGLPQAPVAGFSPQQQQAFDVVGQNYNAAQPYFRQAAGAFGQSMTPDVSQFFNPFAGAVTGNLKDIFGQQMAQTTGQLTQAAGGIGADRIAVGQSNLAKQQGLAAGQTLAQLYQPALGAAIQEQGAQQAAGYGFGALGQGVQSAALSGANALLGTGGLQQQLAQAQMNAPYQWQVARSMFPYQQANFYGGLVSSLAPGLGGTSAGQATYTPAQPSPWSQAIGAGLSGIGLAGSMGAFGGSGKGGGSWGANNPGMPGSSYYGPPAPGQPVYARGGAIRNPFQVGGAVSNEPIDISKGSIPSMQLQPIRPNVPQLQFSQPKSDSGNSFGDIVSTGLKVAGMFLKDGGSVGSKKFDGYDPISFFKHRFPQGYQEGGDVINPDEPYRLPSPEAMNEWRGSVDRDIARGETATPSPLPPEIVTGTSRSPFAPSDALAFAPGTAAAPASAATAAPMAASSPYNIPLTPGGRERMGSFAASPWAALTAAGLGIMGGASPFAGVNIGAGGMQGMKMLEQQRAEAQKEETLAQQAKRLEQEAKFEEEKYARMTPYQTEAVAMAKQKEALEAAKPFKVGMDRNGFDVMGVRDPEHPGRFINAMTGKPIAAEDLAEPPKGGKEAAPASEADGVVAAHSQIMASGPYDYGQNAPYIEKGMDVPDPKATGGHSTSSIQTAAEYYLQTGKLPPVRGGKSPVAIAQQNYRNAVENYGNALAQSRGLTSAQVADMWRTAPGMLRFILGPDGRSTVSLGTAVRHLDTMKQLSDAWKAGDVQTVNRLKAVISREFGNAAVTNLESAARIVGPEIIKAIGVAGAGTAGERGEAETAFSAVRTPEQMFGAIQTTQKLLGGQLEGRRRQAMAAGVTEEKFKGLIGERPYEVLSNIDKGAGAAAPAAKPSQADRDYAKAHPEVRERFIKRFGVEP